MNTEKMYMNPNTGSVDVADGWDSLDGLVEVTWSDTEQTWVEAE